jgi:hypothetical protein
MPATALAAISALQMIFLREDNVAFRGEVILIGFEFVQPVHSAGKVIFLFAKRNEVVLQNESAETAIRETRR